MNPFTPQEFFDLSSFEHAALFEENEPVWKNLKRIALYLGTLSLGKIEGSVDPGAYIVDPQNIFIGKGTFVEPGAYIQGPCYIGENCQVRHGAYIRGNFIAGNGCVIGHATEIKNAVFLNKVHAAHFAYIGDSILGNRVNLGAGAKCANLRFDNQNVPVLFGDKRIDSGLRKFGAILGDDVQIGCNAVTNPGTLMGKKSSALPCISIKGYIPHETLVKSSGEKFSCPCQ